MLWDAAEAAIRAHIEAQWAAGAHAATPLAWENENPADHHPTFVALNVEGTFAQKGIYGSAGKRLSVEGGIVFFHAFTPRSEGKQRALGLVVAMTSILELQLVAGAIRFDGANPPSPAEIGDDQVGGGPPRGQFYRCSGSVEFIVIGSR